MEYIKSALGIPSQPYIKQIFIYPLKSARSVSLVNSCLDQFGFEYDRRWVVVDSSGEMVTQRNVSAIATVQPVIREASLVLCCDGLEDLELSVEVEGDVTDVVMVWGLQVGGIDCGEEANQWITDALNMGKRQRREYRIIRFVGDRPKRLVENQKWGGRIYV
eukprot:TRINITY_DN2833_c0_g1_i1.p1 TRINITY_DN2833_c0_g1~~TRINITY_DN2833_c0_g1_i1.p1  ORF type:complete len:162 (-),score=35.12 TRINITY_DN2833_c0_g1_i1:455-940(-)